MVMDKYYIQNHLHELWQKINSLHLSYLEMEESPQKLDHRNKLEDCINNYLCHVPHNQKFQLRETSEVLYRSASNAKEFSGYKAVLGWDAIGRYAANLITKPWRREYRQIKMYSGFYKHEIESNLMGAEMMFEAMGYRQIGREILYLDGPICPDRVTCVSLDSLIAYVECQILKAIWEEVSNVYNVQWLDILKFRENHLCTPKQSISSLIYLHHERQFQDKVTAYPQIDKVHSFPPMYNHMQTPYHHHIPTLYPVTNGCCTNYLPYPQPQYPAYIPVNYMPMKPSHLNAHYKCNTVPTGQLIELDHTYDVPDGPLPPHTNNKYENGAMHELDKKVGALYMNEGRKAPIDRDDGRKMPSDRDDGSGTFESWDYVYRNLASQGYSKDLGERGDLLSQSAPQDESKARDKKTSNQQHGKSSKAQDTHIKEKKKSDSSLYDNVQEVVVVNKKKLEKKMQNGESSRHWTNDRPTEWQCKTCTYLNKSGKDICEMCSKSRNLKVPEIEVGGSECKKCTFVNSKDQKLCDVCGTSLNNSPIYI